MSLFTHVKQLNKMPMARPKHTSTTPTPPEGATIQPSAIFGGVAVSACAAAAYYMQPAAKKVEGEVGLGLNCLSFDLRLLKSDFVQLLPGRQLMSLQRSQLMLQLFNSHEQRCLLPKQFCIRELTCAPFEQCMAGN